MCKAYRTETRAYNREIGVVGEIGVRAQLFLILAEIIP